MFISYAVFIYRYESASLSVKEMRSDPTTFRKITVCILPHTIYVSYLEVSAKMS